MTKITRLPATTLPLTLLEAEALAFARAWIADCLQRDDALLDMIDAERQQRGRALLRAEMKRTALQHPFLMSDIVYFARAGFEEAAAALREIKAERIERHEPLGAVLGAYEIERDHPRRARQGRKKEQNFYQDLLIYILTEEVALKFGLRATRNLLSKRHPSACSIVAQAFNEAKLGRQFDENGRAVEAIFWRFVPIDAGRRIAAGTRYADPGATRGKGLLD